MKKPPIFIIGNPRSGTTLIRLMLTSHPNIVIPPEAGFAIWLQDSYKNWQPSDKNFEMFFNDLRQTKKFETWQLSENQIRTTYQELHPSNYAELINVVYEAYTRSIDKTGSRWGDKNNFHIHHIADINRLFPGVKFIHIVRDPRAVVSSYQALKKSDSQSPYRPRLPSNPVEIANEWKKNINGSIMQFSTIGWNNVLEIKYEDLVLDTASTLTGICEFINESYDQRMLKYYIFNREQRLEPTEFLKWKQHTLEPPTTSRITNYQNTLSAEEQQLIIKITSNEMNRYQYHF